jgi:cytochrome c553
MKTWSIVLAAVLWLAGSPSASAQGLSGLATQGGVTNDSVGPPGNLWGMSLGGTNLTSRLSPAQMAANCSSCHSADGALQQFLLSTGESHLAPPPLTGMPADQIVARVNALRGDESEAATMHRVLKRYTERQIRDVASYVSRQPAAR